MNKVEDKFRDKAINTSGITLYTKQVALAFVEECRKQNIVILGIDAIEVREAFTRPSMNDSVDFSSTKECYSESIYNLSKEFLNNSDEKFLFEIVCAD